MTPRTTARLLRLNNRAISLTRLKSENPLPLGGVAWHRRLLESFVSIREEWDAFADAGTQLPRIEEVLGEDQGNTGAWRIGLLFANGRVLPASADRFPRTMEAVRSIPGLLSALWSVLEPGAELPTHCGPNAGVLRYHLGVVSDGESALRVAGHTVAYEEGRGVLFDDTAPHAAWNRGSRPRVTLMCEILRPVPVPFGWMNRAVQAALVRDVRYRDAPTRASTA